MINRLSVIIHTKNSAQTLKKSLRSVKWADQIVICDMHSSDESVQIAKEFTKDILSVKDYGYVEPARNTAIQAAKYEWILILDADESISPELRSEILRQISHGQNEIWFLPRKNMMFGGWVKSAGWWPDYQLRLFKKGSVEWQKEIHSTPILHSKAVGYLPAQEKFAIIHDNYRTIEEFVARAQRYSTIQAQEKELGSLQPSALFKTVTAEMMRRLFAEQGVEGGIHAISASLLQSMSELMVMLKAWEKAGYREKKESADSVLITIREFQSELRYWIADWRVKHAKSGFDKIWWQMRRKLRV